MSDAGHNSFAKDRLISIVERIERINEEIADLSEDKKDVFGEAKSAGFDVKVIRECIRLRKQDSNERAVFEEILQLYKSALGMYGDTPLGQAALYHVTKMSIMAGDQKVETTTEEMMKIAKTFKKSRLAKARAAEKTE